MSELPVVSPEVICQPVKEGAVLLHTRTETYFGLNGAGLVAWRALVDGPGTLESVVAAVCAAYPDADEAVVRGDVSALIEDLERQGLLVRESAA